VNDLYRGVELDEEGQRLYHRLLPKIERSKHPDRENIGRSLAYAILQKKRLRGDPDRAAVWSGVVLYCGSALGLWSRFVAWGDLFADCAFDPSLISTIKESWEMPYPADYMTGSYGFPYGYEGAA
jgi:hypothetical protein